MFKFRSKTKEPTKPKLTKQIDDYYKQAQGWAYDCFDSVVVSRNRYKVAFYVMSAFSALLVLAISAMAPFKTVVPIVINTDSSGVSWVQRPYVNQKFTHSLAQIRSEIYHYVQYSESYDTVTNGVREAYVTAMSSDAVFKEYSNDLVTNQVAKNLGDDGIIKIKIESIQFLPNKNNFAIVRFRLTQTANNIETSKEEQIMMSWKYTGLPENTDKQFINYDGFTVTSYDKTNFE
jgi:type IV secretory pathway component VirB8